MLSGSIPLGRLAGAPLRIHWSAVARRRPRRRPRSYAGLRPARHRRRGRRLLRARSSATRPPTPSSPAATASRTTSIDLWALGGMARLEREPTHAARRGLDRRRRTAGQPGHRRRRHRRRLRPVRDRRRRSTWLRIVAWIGLVNVAARHLQPAARIAARRRAHRACRALEPARQPLPGDARGRPGRPGDRLGTRRPRALDAPALPPGQRHLRAADRPVRRHQRPRRDQLRRHQRAAAAASGRGSSRGTGSPRPATTWTPTR